MQQVQEKVLRDFTLSVRLRPDMREKLGTVADSLGVSPATVASMAIGTYVSAQYGALTAAEKQGEAMGKAVTEALSQILGGQPPESESEPCSSSKASSVQLPLLVAEPTKKRVKSSPKEKSSRSKRSTVAASSK